jgi:peptidoglycan hydrolase-like protein with peptidoglycan-binding domain
MRMEVMGVFALGLLTATCGAERTAIGGPVVAAIPGASGSDGLADTNHQAIDPQMRIRMAQSELRREGLYEGKVNGIPGPAFTRGISEFQRLEGLQRTGRLDEATRNRMILNAFRMESASSARTQYDVDRTGSDTSIPSSSRLRDANQRAGARGASSDP